MNTFVKVLTMVVAVSLLMSGCGSLPVSAGQEENSTAVVYESVLGKPITDDAVADFLTSNDCASADQFLLCKTAGMALWTDSSQTVETVYLYVNNDDGFAPYNGELPYGLKFYDTLGAVEYKLNRQGVGNAGLPDASAVPDHMHYRAAYHQAGMTILYNSPFPDEDATIYAILVTDRKGPR